MGGYHTGDIIYSVEILDPTHLICGNLDIERLDILDISVPSAPQLVTSIPKRAAAKLKGNTLYLISNLDPDLEIYDISDRSSPRKLGAIELAAEGGRRDIAIQDNLAVVATEPGGIFVLDISDSANPRVLSALDVEGEIPWGVAIRENLACVAYKNGFIRIFDLSNPAVLTLVSTFHDELIWPHYMVMDGNLMHITDYFKGVSTYDMTDPLAPVRLDRFEHLYPSDIDLHGEYLYEAQFGHLHILDIRHTSQAPVGPVTAWSASCQRGFVTGGGSIDSPAGALLSDESAQGRATFSLNAKYTGSNNPTLQGHLNFDFRSGGLDFKSRTLDSLVVSGAKAYLQGTGTINRLGDHRFRLTAIDGGQGSPAGVDQLRLEIWDNATGAVIYDNQKGASINDPLDASTTVQNGNITVHH